MSLAIETVLKVNGKDVILVQDRISEMPPSDDCSELEPAGGRNVSIWTEDYKIQELMQANPGVEIYGFWQTMLASNKINLRKPLVYWYLQQNAGLFLLTRNGVAVDSGGFVGNNITSALEHGLTLADGEELVIPGPDALTIPRRAAVLRVTLAQRAERSRKLRMLMVGGAVVSMAVGALVVDSALAARDESLRRESLTIRQQATQLKKQAAEAQRSRNALTQGDVQRQAVVLARLAEVAHLSDGLKIGAQSLAPGTVLQAGASRFLPATSFPVSYGGVPTGDVSLSFSADGSTDSSLRPAVAGGAP